MSVIKNIKNSINLKIKENADNYRRDEKEDNKNNAFNKLLQLQLLIQKHSGLKELCK